MTKLRTLRLVLGACALAACGGIALACSVVLDWSGYTGGSSESPPYDGDVAIGSENSETSVDGADDGGLDGPSGDETAAASDAVSTPDSPGAEEAGDAFPGDAPPPCNTACGGCCDLGGHCLGGQSIATCGKGGAKCADCTASGESCVNGACAIAPRDSGSRPACNLSLCPHLCVPVWQMECCKAVDNTCGCQILIPPPPTTCL